MVRINRFDVVWVDLDPVQGHEIGNEGKSGGRPALVVSPNEINDAMDTISICPMTTGTYDYPWVLPVKYQGKDGWVVISEHRAIDKGRIVRHGGSLADDIAFCKKVCATLQEFFAY